MILFIKYMVSRRCKMLVKAELVNLGVKYVTLELGMVETFEELSEEKRMQLHQNLLRSGLELLDDKKSILIEKIKTALVELIHHSDEIPKTNYSGYLSEKLGYDYTYLSNTFSEVKGVTIQHYIISHKIEKVKELLLYDELSIAQIAFKLHYSSAAHLSNQFKRVTGLTPTFYKRMKKKRSQYLENL